MKLAAMAFLVLSLIVLNAPSTYGCTCVKRSHRKEFRQAKAVFTGRVTEIKDNTEIPDKLKEWVSQQVSFTVEKRWKGARDSEIKILTDDGRHLCFGFQFKIGESYLVYAYEKEGALIAYTGSCARTVPLNNPTEATTKHLKQLSSASFRFSARIIPF